MKNNRKWRGILYGIVYGLACRGIFALEDFRHDDPVFHTWGLMTISFMFLVPLVVGLITAYYNDTISSSRRMLMFSMPLFSVLAFVGISVISGMEGIICALMALPIFLFMALLGSVIGIQIFDRRKKDKVLVSVFVLIPFLIAPIEAQFGLNEKLFTEHTTITINAADNIVWQHITRVRMITPQENHPSLFQFMGFPRPIEAELDTIAVGGIRKAIFGRGLFFTETVTGVIPNELLAFNIKADPNSIPPTALDEHVTVGGKYFDVLEGRYRIEKLEEHKIRLHLTSTFRLSTSFNFYSGLWSKLIMRDIQENILQIIKERSENELRSKNTQKLSKT